MIVASVCIDEAGGDDGSGRIDANLEDAVGEARRGIRPQGRPAAGGELVDHERRGSVGEVAGGADHDVAVRVDRHRPVVGVVHLVFPDDRAGHPSEPRDPSVMSRVILS